MYITRSILFILSMLLLSGCANTALPAAAQTESSEPKQADTPMIFLDGRLLSYTGREAALEDNKPDFSIDSVVPSQEFPNKEKEANFDALGTDCIRLADGAAAVWYEDTYTLFLAPELAEYRGIYKQKSELSESTLQWLNFYYSLSDAERDALSMIPSEFMDETATISALETSETPSSYLESLTDQELEETELLAQSYFTQTTPAFEGVDQIYPAPDDFFLYDNPGLEAEYEPGNIIIYQVLTVRDRREGNNFRSISIARNNKSSNWKIINCLNP